MKYQLFTFSNDWYLDKFECNHDVKVTAFRHSSMALMMLQECLKVGWLFFGNAFKRISIKNVWLKKNIKHNLEL